MLLSNCPISWWCTRLEEKQPTCINQSLVIKCCSGQFWHLQALNFRISISEYEFQSLKLDMELWANSSLTVMELRIERELCTVMKSVSASLRTRLELPDSFIVCACSRVEHKSNNIDLSLPFASTQIPENSLSNRNRFSVRPPHRPASYDDKNV